MLHCGWQDIKSSGNFYTWNNKQHTCVRVVSKLDRIMATQAWQYNFPSAEVAFHLEG